MNRTILSCGLSSYIALLIAIVAPTASAHIVPPEDYHSVAEAHRKIAFFVNLIPVSWDLVEAETDRIALGHQGLATAEGDAFQQHVLAAIHASTPAKRKQTAREVFEISTHAVARIVDLHLERAMASLGDHDVADSSFEAARQIWEAFAFEVRATDPAGFRKIGEAWLEASSALGYAGILGIGSKPSDIELFSGAVRIIRDYVNENFGAPFEAPVDGRIAALPVHSPTYDPSATVPPKLPPGSEMNKQLPRPRQILNMAERGVDESDTTLIALGDLLFDSSYIFGDPARSLMISCNTCHNKGVTNPKLFIPGLSTVGGGMDVSNGYFAPHANNAAFDPVDTPDLRGIKFTPPYGRNGRFASLREFVRNVIVNEFKGGEPSPVELDALIAYMNEFDFLPNSKLGPAGMLTAAATKSERRGEALFTKPYAQMNSMSCATCHVPSSHFRDGNAHDIGSVSGASAHSRDGGMDTPTLLSSLYTAPYFHDGSQPTLASVVEWFDAQFSLEWSTEERDDLTAYLTAIGGGEDPYEDTVYTLESEMEEFKFFLSSYDYIREINQPELASVLFNTIASEIAAHKWDVQDMSQLGTLNKLEGLMAQAYLANEAGKLSEVDAIVTEYRSLYEESADLLK
jgi:cytochrome c peroxidase